MKRPGLIVSHFIFWIVNAVSGPHLFSIAYMMLALRIQHQGPPTGRYGTYELSYEYPTHLIILCTGACIFYASYFSLNFFVKRPLRFIGPALFYVVSSLIISLPADLLSEQAAIQLGPVLYFNLCGFLFKACVEWFEDRKLNGDLKKDRDATQLELLQAKIDPHFLFNNLNNIDVFIQEDPARASDYLKKLSDILRFMLYEAGSEKIPVGKEIEYIQKYIELQKIRTSNNNFVTFEINGDPAKKTISPMILIHLIENAFKHAANKKIEDAVVIKLDIGEIRLSFLCRNHMALTKTAGPIKNGLGTALLKQKLDLLYKKEYRLETKEENDWYIVTLDVPLNEDQLHHR